MASSTLFNVRTTASPALCSVMATVSPIILNVTELCKHKAGYMAYSSAEAAGFTILATAISIFILCMFILVVSIATTEDRQRGSSAPENLKFFFCFATAVMVLVAFCFATLGLAVQHQYYCIEDASWKEYRDFFGFVSILTVPCGLIALLSWLFLAINLVIGKWLGWQFATPWGVFIVILPVALVLVIFAAMVDVINGSKYLVFASLGLGQSKYSSLLQWQFLQYQQKAKEGVMWFLDYEILELSGWKSWRIQDAEEGEEMQQLALDLPDGDSDANIAATRQSQMEVRGTAASNKPSEICRKDTFEV